MGGMSSLSFENVFPPDAGDRSDGTSQLASDRQTARLPEQWTTPLPVTLRKERTVGEASPWALSMVRRALDIIVAVLALVAFLPLMICAAILVRLCSAGPVFFRQKRMGRDGSEFTLYKFRSMRPESDASGTITVSGDTRITPIGALLRRYKLDELPQFWNVLRGDMGLVGPRPKLPQHEALHMTCRPGITGAATLAFRNEEEFLSGIPEHELETFYELFVKPAKAHLDLEYMRTASLTSDIRILWRTAAACLFSKEHAAAEPAEIIAQYAARHMAPGKASHAAAAGSLAANGQRVYSAGRNHEA